MAKRQYDYLIYIGRFQPLHLGHQSIINRALADADKVVVLVGSANRPRSDSNPWLYTERAEMIRDTYAVEFSDDRLLIAPLNDVDYNDAEWLSGVQSTINGLNIPDDARVGLIGFNKDRSSYYLNLFPQWEKYLVTEQWSTVSSTDIRNDYFQRGPHLPDHLCGDAVIDYMARFMLTEGFKYVLREFEGLKAHHAQWPPNQPYPVQTVTVDSVCTQSGHILLVTRNTPPGIGLLALPGGHVDTRKGDSFDNAIAELMEEASPMDKLGETRNKPIPAGRLRSCYTGYEKRFDAPNRDPRGYYLTTAFRFVFPDGPLWKVTGDIERNEGVEITKAAWYPISELTPDSMFADHYYIIQHMLDKTGGK